MPPAVEQPTAAEQPTAVRRWMPKKTPLTAVRTGPTMRPTMSAKQIKQREQKNEKQRQKYATKKVAEKGVGPQKRKPVRARMSTYEEERMLRDAEDTRNELASVKQELATEQWRRAEAERQLEHLRRCFREAKDRHAEEVRQLQAEQ